MSNEKGVRGASPHRVKHMDIEWVDGFTIRVSIDGRTAVLSANREGLLSLSRQLAMLADAPPGSHIHLDDCNALEDGSAELIMERKEWAPERSHNQYQGDVPAG